MTRSRRILLAFIIASVLLGVLINFLPVITERLLAYIMATNNIEGPEIEIAHMDLGAIDIKRVEGTYPDAGQRISFSGRNLRLTYSPVRLLQGHIDDLDVALLNLQVTRNPGKADSGGFDPTLIPIPGQWRDTIPLDTLNIRQINVRVSDREANQNLYALHGDLQLNKTGLLAQFEMSGQLPRELSGDLSGKRPDSLPIPLQIEMNLQSDNKSHFLVSQKGQDQKILAISTSPFTTVKRQSETSLTLDIDVDKSFQVLREIGLAQGVPEVSGSALLTGVMKFPAERIRKIGDFLNSVHMTGSGNLQLEAPVIGNVASNGAMDMPVSFEIMDGLLRVQPDQSARVSLVPMSKGFFDGETKSPISRLVKQTLVVRPEDNFSCEVGLAGLWNTAVHLKTEGSIRAEYGNPKDPLHLVMNVTGLQASDQDGLKAYATIRYKGTLSDRNITRSERVSISGQGDLEGTVRALQLTMQALSETAVQNFSDGDLAISSLATRNPDPVTCHYNFSSGEWGCAPFSLDVRAEGTRYQDIKLQAPQNKLYVRELKGDGAGGTIKSEAVLAKLILRAGETGLKLDQIDANVQLNEKFAHADVSISAANRDLTGHIKLDHKMGPVSGVLNYTLAAEDFSRNTKVLSRLFDKFPYPLTLQNGQVSAKGELSWRPGKTMKSKMNFTHNATASVRNVGGQYQNIDFSGLTGEFRLTGFPDLEVHAVRGIHLDKIDPGVPVTGIDMQASLSASLARRPRVRIKNLRAHLLGGLISGQSIDLDLARPSNPFKVEISAVDIGELLRLEQDKGLYGTGIVDGVLPIVYAQDGIHMSEGKLQARAPGGVLKYIARESVRGMAESNPNLQMLLSALENFHYSLLAAGLEYQPDGQLLMQLKLEGRNPDFEDGRAIHLNVRIEENVLTLMRSLRLGEEIGSKIEDRIKQRGNP